MEVRKLEYGHGLAIMILVGELMGLSPTLADDAKRLLDGQAIHPMMGAAIEKEAMRMNELVRGDTNRLAQANATAERLKVQYGFLPPDA